MNQQRNADQIPGHYDMLGDMKVEELADNILSRLEPASCSKGHLHQLSKVNGKGGTKSEYLKLLDFMTGQSSDTILTGQCRTWSGLLSFLQRHNLFRGRRLRDTVLTRLCYEKDGIFWLATFQGSLIAWIKGTGTKKVVPRYTEFTPQDLRFVRIEFNWSETKAQVVDESGTYPTVRLCEVFSQTRDFVIKEQLPDFHQYLTRPLKQQLSIEDGEVTAQGAASSSAAPEEPPAVKETRAAARPAPQVVVLSGPGQQEESAEDDSEEAEASKENISELLMQPPAENIEVENPTEDVSEDEAE